MPEYWGKQASWYSESDCPPRKLNRT